MNDEQDVTQNANGQQGRQRGSMAFPYADLNDAVAAARAVFDGGKRLTFEQLAPLLKHDTIKSGAFRSKVSAARLFGVVSVAGSIVSLTPLGGRIVDPQQERTARVQAFLSVPLFRALHEEFKGGLLPGGTGIEQRMVGLGIAPKQRERARQVFIRSAEQAGFFPHGPGRLVEPTVKPSDPKRDTMRPMGTALTETGSKDLVPSAVQPLLVTLLTDGELWSEDRQMALLQQIRETMRLLQPEQGLGPTESNGQS